MTTTLLSQGEANQATPEARHEVDIFGAHLVGRHEQIALVFAIFVIDDDDHFARRDVGEDILDRIKNFGCHARTLSSSRSTYRAT